ncbi:MAG: translation elongation factor Ts [Alphaproteobacteria bacterium]|nr:translation elongation factor Ts [Alphaproteobacteria bacterium]
MSVISGELIKQLRESSGAGILDCKKALTESQGDMEAATDWLRKKGLASAAKKASRVAAEGLVGVYTKDNKGYLLEINSETDFVARNEQFQKFVSSLLTLAYEKSITNIDALKELTFPGTSHNVAEELSRNVATIGENLSLRRIQMLSVPHGVVAGYVHNAVVPGLGKIGTLIALESTGNTEKLAALGKSLAMHVAAATPKSLQVSDLPQDVVAREKDVLMEQIKDSGKPQEIIDKMIDGKLRKFYQDVVFLEQTYVIDGETRISDLLKKSEKEVGAPVKLAAFDRFMLGEGIEKVQSDFSAEVAAQAGLSK